MTVHAYQSSIVFDNCTFSNIVQRGSSINFDPRSSEDRFNGVFTVLFASITAQVKYSHCSRWGVLCCGRLLVSAVVLVQLIFVLQLIVV